MKHTFLLILISMSIYCNGQKKIFDEYNFETGNYSLVFLEVELVEEEEIAVEESLEKQDLSKPIEFNDYRRHYILDNKNDLISVRKSWEGKLVDYQHMCWYDYFI